uniref:ATP-grasp domain-containing protein n=1 Tax=Chlamydomonas leiostraca TaxID=1034604 RepID=A0A7S0RVH4_9CHLO|mmetsp:Transcript_32767/g.83146  ORF Transcript_32767/g.83146 Transcript_32767/m.83146 type:complete len:455 (+) Transcript_32767:72-1436(+)
MPSTMPRFKTDFDKFVVLANLERRGWESVDDYDDSWDIYWASVGTVKNVFGADSGTRLQHGQLISHFPNHYELTRKDLMVKNIKRFQKQVRREGKPHGLTAEDLDIIPATYVLPQDYALFVEEYRRAPNSTWIMKPSSKSQGKGIFLINKLSQIKKWSSNSSMPPALRNSSESYVVSRYVDNPLLIGGKKFDLRLYVVVTSYRPLTVYMSRLGFGRFCSAKYTTEEGELDNEFVHLTNVAIQKHAPGFDAAKGMKWSIHSLRHFMTTRHGAEASNELFHNMQNLIIRALLAVQPAMINDKHCFELYGYDILIDQSLKPWLLEVNASPSLSASDTSDWTLKFALLEDVLDIVDLESKREPGKIDLHMGGFDLIWDGGPVMRFDKPTSLPTMLGAYNERDRNQLRPKEDGPSHLPTQRPKRAAVSVPTSGATSGTEGGPPQAPPGAGGAAFAASLF